MNKIKEIRKIRGLSQKELAEITGTTNINISYLETSRRGLSEKWIEKFSKALNCNKAQLLGEQSLELENLSRGDLKQLQRTWVYTLRSKKGLSVNELAKKVGVPRTTIWAFENGKASISDDLVKKIAEALNEPYETFLKKIPPTPHLSLVSDNPYPISEKYLRYSMDIYDQVIGSNLHFEEEKAAILYEVYKIVYDFFEKEHHPENEINKIDLKAKAMTGVFELLKRKGKT